MGFAAMDFTMSDIDRLSRRVPVLCKVAPSVPDVHVEDVHRAGGIMAILGELDRAGKLHTDVPTVHAPTLKDALDQWDIVRTEDDDRHLRSILMTFCQPIDATLIRFFGSPRALMVPPTYPDELFIEGSRDGRDFQIAEAYPTSPVIVLPSGPFRSIRISAFTSLQGHNWTNDRVSVLMKGSLPTCGASGMQR